MSLSNVLQNYEHGTSTLLLCPPSLQTNSNGTARPSTFVLLCFSLRLLRPSPDTSQAKSKKSKGATSAQPAAKRSKVQGPPDQEPSSPPTRQLRAQMTAFFSAELSAEEQQRSDAIRTINVLLRRDYLKGLLDADNGVVYPPDFRSDNLGQERVTTLISRLATDVEPQQLAALIRGDSSGGVSDLQTGGREPPPAGGTRTHAPHSTDSSTAEALKDVQSLLHKLVEGQDEFKATVAAEVEALKLAAAEEALKLATKQPPAAGTNPLKPCCMKETIWRTGACSTCAFRPTAWCSACRNPVVSGTCVSCSQKQASPSGLPGRQGTDHALDFSSHLQILHNAEAHKALAIFRTWSDKIKRAFLDHFFVPLAAFAPVKITDSLASHFCSTSAGNVQVVSSSLNQSTQIVMAGPKLKSITTVEAFWAAFDLLATMDTYLRVSRIAHNAQVRNLLQRLYDSGVPFQEVYNWYEKASLVAHRLSGGPGSPPVEFEGFGEPSSKQILFWQSAIQRAPSSSSSRTSAPRSTRANPPSANAGGSHPGKLPDSVYNKAIAGKLCLNFQKERGCSIPLNQSDGSHSARVFHPLSKSHVQEAVRHACAKCNDKSHGFSACPAP